MREKKSSTISTSTATNIHRPLPSAPASLTHERDFSTICNNFQALLAAFFHRIYKLTNLATFWDKPYGSVRCHQCCPASARSDSPGTVLPLSVSVLCSELSGWEEAVHSAGHTAAEPSVKEYKTVFPSTCHLLTVWVINMSIDCLWI